MDFAELLLRAHELWLNKPHILEHYRDRFQNILVDEFQDTNGIQYAWLRMLAGDSGKVMIVGDDDQSIYGWRGAKIENIQRFLTDYQGAETIRLEQNYRSTANILKAANCVIANNAERLGRSCGPKGPRASRFRCTPPSTRWTKPASWLAASRTGRKRAASWPTAPSSIAPTPSRVLEEALMQDAMPYRIYGGLRFFERQEIKDAMAYLRLINNRGDDASFERVVNTPTRGIGDRTLEILRNNARDQGQNLWQSAKTLLNDKVLTIAPATRCVASWI